ncbi:phosphatidylglycerol/phosphatidylinositol transfer protein [[Candida] railenensis]|uniref:Phosphatidylglycerol/phosphatidylinositol transfer protein n=1 Tax=[Candida] railenensis TaxID=45579 RepID=A0A9P0QUQ6_9ASCO|nr:phosphatidylglycerol/phosphatidylinositol transfer protein [[Candida] railenensis]
MVAINKIFVATIATYVSTTNALSIIEPIQPFLQKAANLFGSKVTEVEISTFQNAFGLDDRPVPGDSPIVQCEVHSPQILNLQLVSIDPNPPARGANLTFIAEGYLNEDVAEGAYVDVDVRYGYIRLIHQTFDLCEEISKVDLECPIKKGKQTITKEVEIPNEVPPGKYIINAKAFTKDDKFITCLTAVVDFPPA